MFRRILVAAILATAICTTWVMTASAHHSRGCNTKACMKRVCRSQACKTRVARKHYSRAHAYTASTTASTNPYVDPFCESGGNPQVWDRYHKYWGKYQFDSTTYARFGGWGFGYAPVSEQDRVAARVNYDAWPNC